MNPYRRSVLLAPLAAALLGSAAPARADGLDALEAFLRNVRSARAEFTQVVTGPALAEVPLTVLSLHGMCRRVPPHRGGKFATALPCGR